MTKAANGRPLPFRRVGNHYSDATVELAHKVNGWRRAYLPQAAEDERDRIRDEIKQAERELSWRAHQARRQVA